MHADDVIWSHLIAGPSIALVYKTVSLKKDLPKSTLRYEDHTTEI